jgi:hypothetical protein
VVAEYSLYVAIGRMDAQTLGLSVPYYDPIEHYDTVKISGSACGRRLRPLPMNEPCPISRVYLR